MADELGTGAAHDDAAAVAAAHEDGGDATEALEIGGAAPTTPIGAQRGDEPGDEGRSCAGQRVEDGSVGVIGADSGDALVISGDLLSQDTELSQAGGSLAAVGFLDNLVAGGRDSGID